MASKSSNKESKLKDYKKKRKFSYTPEPEPGTKKSAKRRGRAGKPGDENIFVVQKHDASNLHYDFRLEIGGVLKSWAVPKGPSTDPGKKRLAIITEDHPMEYAGFEGVIPEGYGAGTVMVWDRGGFHSLKQDKSLEQQFDKGHISFWLDGEKLKGGFALTKFKDKNWLLVKKDDEHADRNDKLLAKKPNSVLSNKTIKELSQEKD